jgi:hypothetical protein
MADTFAPRRLAQRSPAFGASYEPYNAGRTSEMLQACSKRDFVEKQGWIPESP